MLIELVSSGRWVWEVILLPYVIAALWSLCSDGIEAISHFPLSCYVMWCFLRGRSHRSYPLHYTELTAARKKVWHTKQMCPRKYELKRSSEVELDVNTLPACSVSQQPTPAVTLTTTTTTKTANINQTLEELSSTATPSNNNVCTKIHVCSDSSKESHICIKANRCNDKVLESSDQQEEEQKNQEQLLQNAEREGLKTSKGGDLCDNKDQTMTNTTLSNEISSVKNNEPRANADHRIVIIQRRLLLGRRGEVHLWVRPVLSTPLIPASYLLPFSHSLHELVSNVIGPIQQPTVLTLPNYHVSPQWPPHYSTRCNSRKWNSQNIIINSNNSNSMNASLVANDSNSSNSTSSKKTIPSYLYSYSSSSEGADPTLNKNLHSLHRDANQSTPHRPYVSTDEYSSSNVNTDTRRISGRHHRLSLLPSLALPDAHVRRRTREENTFTNEDKASTTKTAASTSISTVASNTVKKSNLLSYTSIPQGRKIQNSLSALRSRLFSTLPTCTSRSLLSSLPALSEIRELSTNPYRSEESENISTNMASRKNERVRTHNVVYRIINTHDESDNDTSTSFKNDRDTTTITTTATTSDDIQTRTEGKRVKKNFTLENVRRWWHGCSLYGLPRSQQREKELEEEEENEEYYEEEQCLKTYQEKSKQNTKDRLARPGRKSNVFTHPIASITSHHVLSYQATRQKVLVMDLDETLCHVATSTVNMTIPPSFSEVIPTAAGAELFHVWVRPHVPLFLSTMSRMFNLVLFTSAAQPYAETILRRIDPQQHFRQHFFRQHCRLVKRGALARMVSTINNNSNNNNSSCSRRSSNQTSNNNSFAKGTPSQPSQSIIGVDGTSHSNKVISTISQNKKIFNENSKVFVKDLRMLKVPLELCVMIDNCEECLLLNRENALIIAPYIPSSELMHQATNSERSNLHMNDDDNINNLSRDNRQVELTLGATNTERSIASTTRTNTEEMQTSEIDKSQTCENDNSGSPVECEQTITDETTTNNNINSINSENSMHQEENRRVNNDKEEHTQNLGTNNNVVTAITGNAHISSLTINANTVVNEPEVDEDDDVLLALMPFLESLLTVPDVRSILRNGKTY